MVVRMSDVAELAGVSHGTVSHALNHPERVSAESLERVRFAMDQLGYVRNEAARHLRAGRSTTLGLILIDNWNPFFNELTEGFESAVIPGGWNVIVANSSLDHVREAKNLESFEQRRLAGILIIAQGKQTFERLVKIRERGTPCVLVDQRADGFDIPSVSVDDVAGGRSAGEHLASLGRTRILYVGNPSNLTHAADRLAGLRQGVEGRAKVDVFDVSHLDFPSGLKAGYAIVGLPPEQRPDGVFCANDLLARGVIQATTAHGIDIPVDIAVVGYDDVGYASQMGMPLTSVRQPAYELGRTAGRLLLDDISQKHRGPIQQLSYTPLLIARTSTIGSAYVPPEPPEFSPRRTGDRDDLVTLRPSL